MQKKINFPKSKSVGRIDLGGVVISDNSSIDSTNPKVSAKKGIEQLVAAMSEGIFATKASESSDNAPREAALHNN